MEPPWKTLCAVFLIGLQYGVLVQGALNLDTGSLASVKNVSRQLANSAMKYYDGDKPGQTPGLLPVAGAYNWWEAGALFGQMVEYWYYTGDDKYNNVTKQALLFQAGPENDYQPENQTRTEGNDDQAFWAFAAMSAAEMKFPSPGPNQPSWLSLAQAVFNRQASRWDDKHCNGGLRWQFNWLNPGWMNKNTISNGCFFQLAARLAKYTNNETYANWADRTYEWMTEKSPLISKSYEVFDSIGFTETKCDDTAGPIQWTYNIGTVLAGCAFMYNHTNGAQVWKDRIQGYLTHAQEIFFPADGGNIMIEYACEGLGNCNRDQRSFKAYFSRWLAVTAQLAPFASPQIMGWIKASSDGAAKACVVAADGDVSCGRKWNVSSDDGERDIGNQMTAMSVVQANLIGGAAALANLQTGNSESNPDAGNGATRSRPSDEATRVMTTADKAGAWLLTVLALLASVVGVFALLLDRDDVREYTGFVGGWGGRNSWPR